MGAAGHLELHTVIGRERWDTLCHRFTIFEDCGGVTSGLVLLVECFEEEGVPPQEQVAMWRIQAVGALCKYVSACVGIRLWRHRYRPFFPKAPGAIAHSRCRHSRTILLNGLKVVREYSCILRQVGTIYLMPSRELTPSQFNCPASIHRCPTSAHRVT